MSEEELARIDNRVHAYMASKREEHNSGRHRQTGAIVDFQVCAHGDVLALLTEVRRLRGLVALRERDINGDDSVEVENDKLYRAIKQALVLMRAFQQERAYEVLVSAIEGLS